ncbi:NHLP family bacteriocin export ABC transporter peptidase/permease/ATPase subunit [Streptomyces capitiformicae]|uniref:NHLP family bacteriocin export ABC transporter peptidase/permease/ATPase n=1 Tax=Streptomyces capitiformicae TaxID=2014920 RepID=A0A918ZR66_9ACTN|nr:NHLP family bacteriocin export ABC transporter peptidase/permease/ATPase subunit [Streptomyces capitiformicae]GHE64237.1 NHLP family bacteriocin export ABC transporter peptidase/permease/ATPase [Streptomyces capitiformicae]
MSTTYRKVQTPSVLQMEVVECGAASLAMVLAYYRRFVPLEELRVACGVSRDGSKASNLIKAARSYGMVAKGMQLTPESLAGIKPPAIVFWEFNHFIVLEGIGRRWGKPVVYVNDPAEGRRVLTAEEFDEGFTGVALLMEPGDDFKPGGRRPGILAGLPARLRGTGGMVLLGALASLLLMVLGVATPAFTRAYVDNVLLGGDTSILMPLALLMACTVAGTVALTALRQSFLVRAQITSATLSSARFLRHLFRLPLQFFAQRSAADLTSRMSSNENVAQMLSRDLSGVVVDALVVLLYAGLLWSYNPELTMLGVAMALLNVVALRTVARLRSTRVHKLAADESTMIGVSYNGLELIETLKATGGENEYFRKWAGAYAKVLTGEQRTATPTAVLSVVAPTLAALNSAMILLVGGLQAVEGHITIGVLVAFQALITSFTGPITQLTGTMGQIQDFGVDVARLRDVENFPPEDIDEAVEPERVRKLDGRVRFDDVTFGYSPLGVPQLADFTLEVGPGEQIALVGGSGSGKSTVSRLMAGHYQPWNGAVLVDGLPRTAIPRSVLAASVAFVDQEIFLFEGTVRDNVTLWDTTINDDEVVAALKDAEVYDVVSGRKGGIHSRVLEDGRNFSGGQRQRLEIARALVRAPSVLVLDEATSALDAETERRITANLRRRGCATVVIAHRLSTIRDSDEILVLNKGSVVERGKHDDLVLAGGPYAELIREH